MACRLGALSILERDGNVGTRTVSVSVNSGWRKNQQHIVDMSRMIKQSHSHCAGGFCGKLRPRVCGCLGIDNCSFMFDCLRCRCRCRDLTLGLVKSFAGSWTLAMQSPCLVPMLDVRTGDTGTKGVLP